MKIELRKIKHYPSLSEETNCFTADIFVNGKRAGYAKNSGHGEETHVSHFSETRDLFKSAEAFCKLLPPYSTPGLTNPIPMDLALFVDNLLETYLVKLDQEKALRKLDKLTEKKIVILNEKEFNDFKKGTSSALSYRTINYKRNLSECSPESLKIEIGRVKKSVLAPGEIIYNDFSYLDMIYNPQHDATSTSDWKLVREKLQKNFEILQGIDQKSRALGQLLYRYFYLSVADGKAYYQIIAVTKTSARVRLCQGISPDEYADNLLGESSTLLLSKATEMVKGRDALEDLFKKTDKTD